MVEAGQRLGVYRLLRELGSGGMGRVWLAERDDGEFLQQVAIKVLKRGMDSEEILRRFRIERQILAQLAHPHIARLLDGGLSDDGLPYLVMEYVDGTPLDDYCRAQQPGLEATLRLFMAICNAVQYAHQRLLVHRDLKPGNILVTRDGTPKLLDFGIAKLLHADGSALTRQYTAQSPLMLTPRYASPEQVRGEAITTASDVYALGCLLYELLSGRHPFEEALDNNVQLLRDICQREALRPSAVATSTRWPARSLQGDLDNIVLTALRKEPERRYASVEQLHVDVARHLGNQPVSARTSTLGYRTGKLLRRNPAAAIGVLGAVLALLGGTAVSVWQARVAQRERARAEQRLDDVRKLANSMIFEVDAELENGPTRARAVLVERALQYLDSLRNEALGNQLKRDLAAAYEKIGDIEGNYTVINQLGRSRDALKHYELALTMRQQLVQAEPANADYQSDLAGSLQTLGDMSWTWGNVNAAHDYYSRAAVLLQELVERDPTGIARHIALARARTFQANVLYSSSRPSLMRYVDSMNLHRLTTAALAALRPRYPEDAALRYQLEGSLYETGSKLLSAGDPAGALPLLLQAQALTEEWRAAEPDSARAKRAVAIDLKKVAEAHAETGDLPGALAVMNQSLEIRAQLARSDPGNAGWQRDLGVAHYTLGDWSERSGQFAEAVRQYAASHAIHAALFARDPENVVRRVDMAESGNALGNAQAAAGSIAAADSTLAAVARVLQQTPAAQRSAQISEQEAMNAAAMAEVAAARGAGQRAAELALTAVRLQSERSGSDPLNVYAARELARLQWRAAQLLAGCSGAILTAKRCGELRPTACELIRTSADTWQRLQREKRLAPDFLPYARRTEAALQRCPQT